MSLLLATSSCYHEEVEPLVQPEIIGEKTVNFSFFVGKEKIDNPEIPLENIPLFGFLLGKISRGIINSFLKISGKNKFQMDPIQLNLEEIENIDFSIVDDVEMKSITLYIKQNNGKEIKKNFIEKVDVYLKGRAEVDGIPSELLVHLLKYVRAEKRVDTDVLEIPLEINKIDWKKFLINIDGMEIVPEVSFGKVPKRDFTIWGRIEFSARFKIPF